MNAENPLSGFKFFSEVDPDSLESIGRMCETVAYKVDDVIFRFDEPAAHLYGVIEGKIDLSVVFTDKVLKTEIVYEEAIQANMVEEEKSIVVDSVLPGQVFGWASLVGAGRRTVTASCAQASRVFALPAAGLKTMFEADKALG